MLEKYILIFLSFTELLKSERELKDLSHSINAIILLSAAGNFNTFFNDKFQPKNYSIEDAIINSENYQNIIPSILYNSQILSDDEGNNTSEDYTIQKLLNIEIFPLKILLYNNNLSLYNEVSDIQLNNNLYLGTEYTNLSSITILKDGCYSCNSQISSILIPENIFNKILGEEGKIEGR